MRLSSRNKRRSTFLHPNRSSHSYGGPCGWLRGRWRNSDGLLRKNRRFEKCRAIHQFDENRRRICRETRSSFPDHVAGGGMHSQEEVRQRQTQESSSLRRRLPKQRRCGKMWGLLRPSWFDVSSLVHWTHDRQAPQIRVQPRWHSHSLGIHHHLRHQRSQMQMCTSPKLKSAEICDFLIIEIVHWFISCFKLKPICITHWETVFLLSSKEKLFEYSYTPPHRIQE